MIFLSCNKTVKVENFNPFSNWEQKDDTIHTIYLDYTDAIDSGFVIPSKNQVKEGAFAVSFDIDNGTDTAKEFYYKIYYQNESYKFPEVNVQDTLVSENFYGSWENTSKTFVSTGFIESGKKITIKDEIRIVGNPRNEIQFFSSKKVRFTDAEINEVIEKIKFDPKWYEYVQSQAKLSNKPLADQLKDDAIYSLSQIAEKDKVNHRWKKNPRVGNYKFILVVVEKEVYESNQIPEYIKDISKTSENRFVNPFYYFLHGQGKDLKGVYVSESNLLKVIAKPNIGAGIYVDPSLLNGRVINKSNYSEICGESEKMYKNATFQQFFHDLRSGDIIKNIPVVEDIFNNKYTEADFEANQKKYTDDKLIPINVQLTDCPCKTVKSDSENNKIVMYNPGTKEGEWKKESVGVKTRHGFTYGKYRAKVKMTSLLNKDGVWNGITNAIWLIYDKGAWNARRSCDKDGYIPKDVNGPNAKREKIINYSEIDFEIIKTSKDWPNSSYSPIRPYAPFKSDKKDDIIVACTNWDLACPAPPKYDIGVHALIYKKEEFILHRWDNWYQALTIKTPANERELFGSEFYYFEIDWRPTEIIWRIGPSPDKMKVVGYMNDEYTSIPNNQMLMIFTQEFHLGNWWPMTKFHQNYIPFPKSNYTGEIYELVIE